jgi:hypothetical protein
MPSSAKAGREKARDATLTAIKNFKFIEIVSLVDAAHHTLAL